MAALIDFGVDLDGNGIIGVNEAEAVSALFLDLPFYDSKGIEAFINLEKLWCSAGKLGLSANNKLTELDVSNNLLLETLDCSHNQLSQIEVGDSPELRELNCDYNQLSQLAISKNIKLNFLQCQENQLSQLITTYNTELYRLYCGGNQLQRLDIWNNEQLYDLRCGHNLLSYLDLRDQAFLQFFHCDGNPISQLDLSENTHLLEIGLGEMFALQEVCVWTNPFPPEHVSADTTGSSNVFFTVNCTIEY